MINKSSAFSVFSALGFIVVVGEIYFAALQKAISPEWLPMVMFPMASSFVLFTYIRLITKIIPLSSDPKNRSIVQTYTGVLLFAATLVTYYAVKL